MCKHFGKRLKVKGIKKPENQSTFLSFRVAKLRIFSQSYKFYAHKFEICRNYSFKTLSLFSSTLILHFSTVSFLSLLLHHDDESATRLTFLNRLDGVAARDVPRSVLVAAITELGDIFAQSLQTFRAESEGLLLICSVDAGNIPSRAALAGNDGALSRIAAQKYGLVPCSRQIAEVVLHLLRLSKETLRTVGKMLQTAFV